MTIPDNRIQFSKIPKHIKVTFILPPLDEIELYLKDFVKMDAHIFIDDKAGYKDYELVLPYERLKTAIQSTIPLLQAKQMHKNPTKMTIIKRDWAVIEINDYKVLA